MHLKKGANFPFRIEFFLKADTCSKKKIMYLSWTGKISHYTKLRERNAHKFIVNFADKSLPNLCAH